MVKDIGQIIIILAALVFIYLIQIAALDAGFNGTILKSTIGLIGMTGGFYLKNFITGLKKNRNSNL